MYIYKIAYSDYDEYDYIYLKHEKKFSNDELRMLVFKCMKEIVEDRDYDTPPCLLSTADFFNRYNHKVTIGNKMVRKYGFSYFHFEADVHLDNFEIFKGKFAKIYDLDHDIQCCHEECSFSDKELNECPCTDGDVDEGENL